MIEKRKKRFVPKCDICGAELEPENSFADARDIMKIANWKSRQDSDGKWQHWCDECIYLDKLDNPQPTKPTKPHSYYRRSKGKNKQ